MYTIHKEVLQCMSKWTDGEEQRDRVENWINKSSKVAKNEEKYGKQWMNEWVSERGSVCVK